MSCFQINVLAYNSLIFFVFACLVVWFDRADFRVMSGVGGSGLGRQAFQGHHWKEWPRSIVPGGKTVQRQKPRVQSFEANLLFGVSNEGVRILRDVPPERNLDERTFSNGC